MDESFTVLPVHRLSSFLIASVIKDYESQLERSESLQLRVCIKLDVQYVIKLKAFPSNAAFGHVFNPLYEYAYDKQPNAIQPFGLRVNTHFENSDINLNDIAPIVIPENPHG